MVLDACFWEAMSGLRRKPVQERRAAFVFGGPFSILICGASFSVVGTASSSCTDRDWRFQFGECGAAGVRSVYPYVPSWWDPVKGTAVPACDVGHADSKPMPEPVFDVPCSFSCRAGTHQAVGLLPSKAVNGQAQRNSASTIGIACKTCPAGRFSLGGGTIISGNSADWRRPWPKGLVSSCLYETSNAEWLIGGDGLTQGGSATCAMRIESPLSVAGGYAAAPARWNGHVHSSALVGALAVAPHDGLACGNLESVKSSSFGRPVVLLVWQGGCSPTTKARQAASIGAIAVVLITHGYHTSLVALPGLSERNPPGVVPLVVIGREDGDVLAAIAEREEVVVNLTAPSCTTDQEFALTGAVTTSLNMTRRDKGCSPWQIDPSGRFVHSGDNRAFNSISSRLSWHVHLVRDGYVVFRYKVEAEERFDGLSFAVDWQTLFENVGSVRSFQQFRVNLTAGVHIIEWVYGKDMSDSEGEDRAFIELIEIVGTAHGDTQCTSCQGSGTHSVAGSKHCNACGINEFLEVSGVQQLNLAQCSACPSGKWSPPGSIGVDACKDRHPCGLADVETTFTPCRGNRRFQRKWWREPITCDPDLPGATVSLGTSTESVSCEPCQPHEGRPSGGECEPLRVVCPSGSRGVEELRLSQWRSWPKNTSRNVWTMSGDLQNADDAVEDHADVDHPHGHGWKLNAEGSFAYAGNDAVGVPQGSGTRSSPGDGSGGGAGNEGGVYLFGDAMLHFDLLLSAPGDAEFVVEMVPHSVSLQQEVRLLLDGVTARASTELLEGGRLTVRFVVPAGKRRVTWVWQYQEDDDASKLNGETGASGEAGSSPRGIRIHTVSVTNVVGAGSSRCEICPVGHEVSSDGLRCQTCSPGTALYSSQRSETQPRNTSASLHPQCQPCKAGFYSARPGSSVCSKCVTGTDSIPGSAECTPVPLLSTKDPEDFEHVNLVETVDFNMTATMNAWMVATNGVQGPFEIAGHLLMLGLFHPVPTPAGTDRGTESAYIWELLPKDAPRGAASGSGGGGGAAARCSRSGGGARPTMASPTTKALHFGATIASVEPIVSVGQRGLKVVYGNGEHCNGLTGGGGDGAARTPLASRSEASFFFRCDPYAPAKPLRVRQDDDGVYHLPGLVAHRIVPDEASAQYRLMHKGEHETDWNGNTREKERNG
eukprot:TRINITY_DN28760_c0_g1_i3.p1 TRINITY_DN28760_c0_g1~~TRINITY_DN28760_c0_g1_i3.p1  ORF type:complete len:1163 (-),score=150.10 TRINITY_DN28760_c0_g1_i3:14-3502(-)